MLQILLVVLGGVVAIMGLSTFVRGQLKISRTFIILGQQARITGAVVLALGLSVVVFSIWILPTLDWFRFR